ncbi:MAG: endo-1,4-beta-xylanase [Bacteroidales bacterium]|nr:endo-1,4-beta-xylanase [Bacteroidales bacterium]
MSILSIYGCVDSDNLPCDDSTALSKVSEFPLGTAIKWDEFQLDTNYFHIAKTQFSSYTPENIFKSENLHPTRYNYNWEQADSLMSFCLNNSKRLHGHTLIWHKQLPQWIIDFQGNKSEWEEIFRLHIITIVQHFKGKIKSWDVVNEAFDEDGTLSNTLWKEKIGPGYIEKAFRYAEEADPECLLFYNDFNLESNPVKRTAVLNYLDHLRSRGVKVDGIGLQMHIDVITADATLYALAFRSVYEKNYQLHLSELDISLNPSGKNIVLNEELLLQQADIMGKIVNLYKQVPLPYQYGITFWGISDKNSWIRSNYNRMDYPLLYDDQYNPKPAYCKIKSIL